MSEVINQGFEAHSSPETHKQSKEMLSLLEKESKHNELHKSQDIEKIRESIEKHATSKEVYSEDVENEKHHSPSHHYLTKKVKANQYRKTLQSTRQSLRPASVLFSKFIHNPSIETASEIGSKTIVRPKSIIIAGIFSFIGGVVAIVIAKRVGFELPFSLIITLYILGYFCGLIFELITTILKRLLHKTELS